LPYCIHGDQKIEISDQQEQTYNALQKAAERIGLNNYAKQQRAWLKNRKSVKTFRFVVTDGHQRVIDAMSKVLSGKITPEEAMGILHEYEVLKERLSTF